MLPTEGKQSSGDDALTSPEKLLPDVIVDRLASFLPPDAIDVSGLSRTEVFQIKLNEETAFNCDEIRADNVGRTDCLPGPNFEEGKKKSDKINGGTSLMTKGVGIHLGEILSLGSSANLFPHL